MEHGTASSREERGRAIAAQGDQIKKIGENSFKVKSQSSNRNYEVKNSITGMTGSVESCGGASMVVQTWW